MYSKTLYIVLYITSPDTRYTERCSRTRFPIGPHTVTDVRTHNTQTASNILYRGPGILVGMATGYGLDGLGIESWWGAVISALVHTGPEAQPTSCTMGTVSFPGMKSDRSVTLTTVHLLVPWSLKGRTTGCGNKVTGFML